MTRQTSERHGAPPFRWFTLLAGGYLMFFYLAAFILIVFFAHKYRQQIPWSRDASSTPVPAPTSTPGILVHPPKDAIGTISEGFSNNYRNWGAYYTPAKVQVLDGKLILQSNSPDNPALATNETYQAAVVGQKYLVQADFTTEINTYTDYGLVFNMNRQTDSYYLFSISPPSRQYGLFKHLGVTWYTLVPHKYASMHSFPEINTLSAYVNGGRIELFINGNPVTSYLDERPLTYNGYGAFIDGEGVRLIVDNFFTYMEK